MWLNIAGQSVQQLVVMLLLMSHGHEFVGSERDDAVHRTCIFNTFILMQIWNEFNARKLYDEINVFEGMNRSRGHILVFFVMLVFQVFAVEFAGEFMTTTPLTLHQWMVCGAFGAFCIPLGFILRLIPVKEPEYARIRPAIHLASHAPKTNTEKAVHYGRQLMVASRVIRRIRANLAHKRGGSHSTWMRNRTDTANKITRMRGASIHMIKN
eukprot:NODE_2585_length_1161_cov_23.512590_g2364_i0.p2 GENE.NODE_2585_length_1161_cov_23.512590_g2364_i0~~NODE_2585_length_1161_cov_23.512590_g2364_i0.p2  ORF type:complete len:211 (-),score=29.41 NODE_2585_length_1161_cov_23.512590_g2364_i0:384-1016(-)